MISEEKAGGFQYTVVAEDHKLIWEIGNHYSSFVIEEIKKNEKELNRFKNAVDDIERHQFVILIDSVYLLFVIIVMVIVIKKVKEKKKSVIGIISLFSIYATYKCLIAYINLQEAPDNAQFYYRVLT